MLGIVPVVGLCIPVEEILLVVVDCGEITEIPVTSGEGQLSVMDIAMVAVDLVPPVHAWIGVWIRTVIESPELGIAVLCRKAVQRTGLIQHETISIAVGKLRSAEHLLEAILIAGSHLEGAGLAPLCRDHDDAVATLDSIQSRSGSILEHGHGLDLDAGKVIDAARETVHQYDRAVAMQAQGKLQLSLVGGICA